MTTIDHTCIHVLDLDRSAAFYRDALGLTPVRSLDMPDRGWQLLFLGDGTTDFQLELCRETNRTEPYHLGDDTPHLALRAQDFDALKAKHRALGLPLDQLFNLHRVTVLQCFHRIIKHLFKGFETLLQLIHCLFCIFILMICLFLYTSGNFNT